MYVVRLAGISPPEVSLSVSGGKDGIRLKRSNKDVRDLSTVLIAGLIAMLGAGKVGRNGEGH